MQHPDPDRNHFWSILELAVLAAIVFVSVQAAPVYLRNRKLADHLHRLAGQPVARYADTEAIQSDVITYARSLNLPVDRQNVRVGTVGGRLTIQLKYEVPVDLEVCTWVLHFEPSAENWSP
jgi:hypothetical protein